MMLAALSKGHRCACHARLLTTSTWLRACAWHALRPLHSNSRRQQEGFLFFDLPACFFRSREVKKLLGPLGPKPSRSDGFPFLEVSLWHTQSTRRRDGQRFS